MKNKLLKFIIALTVVSNFALSQSKPLTKKQLSQSQEYVAAEHIILVAKNKKVNLFEITTSNTISLLGKPKHIQKVKSEIDDQIHSSYIYESGEIDFDAKGNLYGLEIKNQGWAFILKVNDKVLKPLKVGSTLNDLRNAFPRYFNGVKHFKNQDMYGIELITKKRIPIESAILFGLKNGRVVYLSFAEDDS